MDLVRLKRTGDAVLEFQGECVAEGRSHNPVSGPLNTRWHGLGIYRTAGGKFVLAIDWRTQWEGEEDHHAAEVFDSAIEIREYLRAYSPTMRLVGYPLGEQYAEKRARLEAAITAGWERLVSEVLAALPEAAERID